MRLRPLSFRRKLTIGLFGLLLLAFAGALVQRRVSGRNNLFAASTPAGTTHTLAHSPNTLQPNALFMSGCMTPSFAAAANFATGANPRSAAVGDFNLDGRPDLVTANQTDENISLRLGDGAGGFGAANNFNLNVGPRSIAVGDFNLDGNPDVATASFNSDTIVVLLGNGTGGFGAPANFFPGGSNPTSVAVGDFNLDGRPDLVTANEFDNNVSVLLGNGAGSFGTATNFSGGINPQQVIVADFNLDGRPDLATASQGDNTLQVLLGNGLGSFGSATGFTVGSFPRGVTAGDFNQDGRPDLAAANFSSSNVSVILGDGAGNFGAAANFNVGLNPRSIQISDYNQDGKPDVATANENANNVSVLLGDGAGSLSAATNFTVGTGPQIIATGDFNRDGRPDLASANAATNNASVLLNTCNGTPCGGTAFGAATNYSLGAGAVPLGTTTADFNRDGKPDLAVAARPGGLSVLLGNGAGSFGAATNFGAVGGFPQFVAVGDFNRDGKPDAAVANAALNLVTVFLGDGAGGFGTSTNFSVSAAPQAVAVGDFNLDGNADFVTANDTANTVTVRLGNGAGSFGAALDYGPVTNARFVTVGDFNLDGKPDLAVAGAGSSSVVLLNGNGTGSFVVQANFSTGAGTSPVFVTAGDFNQDGNADLITANVGTNNISVLLGNGAGSFGAPTIISVGTCPQSVAVSDFNLDGKLDLAVPNGCNPQIISVLLGNGAGGFGAASTFGIGPASFSATTADFNLDGKPDLAATNQQADNVSVLLNSCAANTPPSLSVLGPLTISQGSDNNLNIALATDPDQPNNTLTLTVTPLTGSGVSYAGFANDLAGTNAAIVTASCTATNSTFLLTVTDNMGAMVTGVQTVNVTPNTAPSVGAYPANLTATTGGGQIAIPNAAPTDNGAIASVTATAPGFTGTLTGNPATGAITVSNAGPAGTYNVTVLVTDNCGTTFSRNFNLTVTAPSASGCATPTFGAATNFLAVAGPRSAAVGDFNLDGRPDLAMGHSAAATVSVFLGNGAGGFGAAINFTVGDRPRGIVAGDFNLDGRPDLATANFLSNNVSVLLGNGSGSFGAATNFAVGSGATAVAVGDFNLDGKPDLVAANNTANNLSVLLGDGAGSFGAATNFAVGTNPRSVTVSDFNQDGKPDLVAANELSNNVSVLLGNGAGSFGAVTNFAVGTNPQNVAVGDFNQDGRPDLAAANINTNNVSVLLGNGAGSFGAATNFFVGFNTNPRSVVVGDFNLDGKLDVATANGVSNNISVLLGDGAGSLGAATNFSIGGGTNPFFVVAGDFNLDGRPDLVSGIFGNNTSSVLLNTCNGTPCGGAAFGAATNFSSVNGAESLTTSDFNLDGKLDVATANGSGNNISVLLGTGAGTFGAATTFANGTAPLHVAAGDFNLDGKPDLATANPNVGNVSIFIGNGAGGFGAPTTFSAGTGATRLAVSDFNLDGRPDLAAANLTNGQASLLLGNGAGGFGAPTTVSTGNGLDGPRGIVAGDFNLDGRPDVATANSGTNTVSVLLGNGAGGLGAAARFAVQNFPFGITAGDFNQDGKLDLAAANNNSNSVSVLLGNGAGSFGAATNFAAVTQTQSVAVGDFNQDGKPDLAAGNGTSANVSIFIGNGAGSFAAATNFTAGAGQRGVAVGDFNQDGKPDLATANFTANNVAVLLNSCSATNTPPTITAGGPLSRQQGSAASNSTIATVSDDITPAGSVVVTVTSANPSNGVTISNIVNTGGTVTADVVASCTASNATFTLTATDGGSLTNTATLTVNVTANTQPTFGAFPANLTATTGGGQIAIPTFAPTDNGSIASFTATAPGFTGTLNANPSTGVVTIANANPAGTFTVTVTATDNCGSGSFTTFRLTVVAPSGSGCATPSFGAAANFAAGAGPRAVVPGDFNLDGRLDMATANANSNNISVFLGNGSGGFGAATNFNTDSGPTGIAIADMNLDGRPDLLTSNNGGGDVSVLLGNGAGGFPSFVSFGAGISPNGIAVADFNLDGRPDAVVTDAASANFSLLLGNGAGSLGGPANFTVGNIPVGITAGDFNLDGKPDVAVANSNDNNVSVMLGNGAGSFGPSATVTVGTNPLAVATGDFNQDGRPDLATANLNSNNVSVLLGNGVGNFVAATNFPVGASPRSVVTGDFNQDGRPDLATANSSNSVSLLSGNGAGGFGAATNFGAGSFPIAITTGDFNQDGRPDLATANFISDNASVLLNTCNGTPCSGTAFGAATNFAAQLTTVAVTVSDFNLDGKPDLAATNRDSNSVSVFLGNGAGSFGAATNFTAGTNPMDIIAGDFNLDGKPDLATTNVSSGDISVLLGNGAGSFGAPVNFPAGTTPRSITTGDFNLDGKPDLAVANQNSNDISILLGNGAGSFGAATNFAAGATPVGVATGDFNQDGKPDLAAGNFNSSNVSILLGNGAGSFSAATNFSIGGNSGTVAVGDFNLDGKSDLAVANNNSASVAILLGLGTGSFGAATSFATGTGPNGIALADFNRDGKSDLAVSNFSSNNVSLLIGTGAGSFGTAVNLAVGTQPVIVAAGDFNLDGKPDLATANSGTNNVSVLLNSCVANTPPTITAGGPLSRQQGSAATNSPIATVSDAETAAGSVVVTVTGANPANGVTISNIVNTGGTITADVVANCTATNATFTLTATDGGGLTNTATLTVNVTGNTQPAFGAFPANLTATTGGGQIAIPTFPPTDNGSIASFTATAPGFTGTLNANPSTGVVTIANANPAGTFTVTVTATDNCGSGSFTTFRLTVVAPSGSGCATPSFGAAANFAAGTNPDEVVTGDFNLDGRPDLAVANQGSNNVSVLLGNGAGGFGAATNFAVGATPRGLVAGDFNLDGRPDLATANLAANNVSVLLGDGAGSFGTATNFSTGTNPVFITTGDFNLDGRPDLVTTNSGSDSVSLLLGNGAGSFGTAANFSVGTAPRGVSVGDFNLDGRPDLAVANQSSGNVSVLLGNGAGSFGAATNFSVGTFSNSVAVGDFNRDGRPDLAVTNFGGNNVSILLGNGTGSFSAATNFSGGAINPIFVAVGDFNQDGQLDLATGNNGSASVSILLGNGAGGFGASATFTVGTNPGSLAVGDFNLDGRPDLATANNGSNNASVLLNTCNGTPCGATAFGAATNFATATNPASIASADFNLDGKSDLATANQNSNNVSVLLGNGAGSFGAATNFAVGTQPQSVAAGDFNLDGRPDLATANGVDNNISILLGNGAGSFGAAANFGTGIIPVSIAAGDFNLDGKPDLATANQNSANISILLGNGAGSFGAATNFAVGNQPLFVAVGDFNLDGKPDLAAANFFSNNVSVLLGNGAGNFGAATNFTVGTQPRSIAVGDFNLDGKPDLATANQNSNNVSVLLGNGAGSFGAATNFAAGVNPLSVAAGDFNLDGKSDLAVALSNTLGVAVLLGNGAGNFGAASPFTVGNQPLFVAVGDFNLDGKPDFAAANQVSNNVSVLLNSCVANTPPTITAGGPLSRQQGSAATNSTIATVSDPDQTAGSVNVAVTSANPGNGVTISNIVNTNGTITADVLAACAATNATFTLTATDNAGAMTNATLTVNVTANTAPTLGTYPTTNVNEFAGATVTPSIAPTDNGSVATLTATAPGFTGTLTGNPATGVITVTNAAPVGMFTVTVTATDNCGATSNTTFTLNVAAVTILTVTNTNDSGAGSLRQAILDSNSLAGPQMIQFNIPGTGVQTIAPTSGLPLITDPVTIDGYTQPGSSPNSLAVGDNAVINIELNGANTGSGNGLRFTAGNSLVRGLAVNRCANVGIIFIGASGNRVQGSFIGTNAAGTAALGNSVGVEVTMAGLNHIIGTDNDGFSDFAERNIISGNTTNGVRLQQAGTSGNRIAGNYIGTNAAGTVALPNNLVGIRTFSGATATTIGGTTLAARNIISGNNIPNSFAIAVDNENLIQGNYIGVAADGVTPLGNAFGLALSFATNSIVGGTAAGAGNIIAHNANRAVIVNAPATGNFITGNSIFNNSGLGIDLGNDGVTANDLGDGDTGPNGLQNFPVLAMATSNGANTTVNGTLNSMAGTTYRVEFFSNPACDASGNGEGQVFLGFQNVTTDGAGNAAININTLPNVPVGQVVTATATNATTNDTSEFSVCRIVTVPNANPAITAGGPLSRQQGSAAVNSQIATVSDADQAANTLSVTATALTGAGVTVTGISIDGAGNVTANVAASCAATNSTFTLTVTDNMSAMTTATLTVNVTANTPPTLGVYGNSMVMATMGATVTPSLAPTDNGSVATLTASAPGFTGVLTGNPATGVITITNAGPVAVYTVTVTATDNCGAASTANFTLTVNPLLAVIVTNTNDSGAGSLRQAIIDSNNNTGVQMVMFNIAGSGVQTITPATPLPVITQPVVIDGYTQPGASANSLAVGDNAVLLIELNGATANASPGLQINAAGSSVRGLVINNFTSAAGILLTGLGATGNTIDGNFIGINPAGTVAAPNRHGVDLAAGANNNAIGGVTPAARNIVSGNSMTNIRLRNPDTANNTVRGSYIGTNPAGTSAFAGPAGILLDTDSITNEIGGAMAGAGNVIAGTLDGITIAPGSETNAIRGNFVGLNAAGTGALACEMGIVVIGDANTIGGATLSARNVISGNTLQGISIAGVNTVVSGNFIGTDAAGTAALPNGGSGVTIFSLSNTIGGAAAGTGNVIFNNGGNGVEIDGATALNNAVLGNAIGNNAQLGISLTNGANNSQPAPTLALATSNGANTTVTGTLNSASNTTYRVEFFSNPTCDASGAGEGQIILGFANVTTDGAGNATINSTTLPNVTIGQVVTATATNLTANETSQFSVCRTVTAPNANPTITAAGPLSRQQGSAASNSPIATISDVDQAANTLNVVAAPLSGSGVTVSGIAIDGAGNVTANVAASCTATNSTFTLTVTDNMSATATATLTVNVTANTAPTLGTYPSSTAITGGGATVTPSVAPTDNGSIATLTASAPGFTGTLTGNPATGVIIVTNAGPGGNYTVTVTATDNCGATTNATFTLAVNAAPTITAAGPLSRQQGSAAANSQIATISDVDQAANALNFSFTPLTGAGVTISAIAIDGAGNVTANVAAGCAATNSTFTLTVTDNMSATATVTLTVNVTANTAPTIGTYANTSIVTANSATVTPSVAPTDNGSVATLTATASGGFTGTLSGAAATGVITIVNAAPAGVYTITVTATDNCGATANSTFSLAVNAAPTIAAASLARQQGSPTANSQIATVSDFDQAANTLNVVATPLSGAGVTVSNILINGAGNVTANVAASCAATNSTFTLTVTDNMSATATAVLSVSVNANTPPALGVYSNTGVAMNSSVTVTPSAPPSDNGSLSSLTVMAGGGFSGTISINPLTGVVTVNNAAPIGNFVVTITATDNCGATSNTTFMLSAIMVTTVNVTNTNDSGAGSLRQAILDANALTGLQTVVFNIAGSGVQTITPISALPTITDPVTIDGMTQPGFSGTPLIELNGAGLLAHGLTVTAGSTTVKSLIINRFNGNGILLTSGGGNTIQGSRIGTNAAGTTALANNGRGISIVDSPNNNIGGAAVGVGNLISGNGDDGIAVESLTLNAANGNTIQGNFVGTNAAGTAALPNGDNGIAILGANNCAIGGALAGAGNIIANNGNAGVRIDSPNALNNSVLGNAISANAQLGLDLNGDGVSPNDTGDGDSGPNNLQNFPALNFVTNTGTVNASLNSAANATFRVEFFANTSCDTSGNGEGQSLLGAVNVNTDGAGNANNFTFNFTPNAGQPFITATATDGNGNTSEYSPCRLINTLPAITASAPLNQQQGSPGAVAQIATVSDSDQTANTLSVVAAPLSGTGVTVAGISIDGAGNVTANIIASCAATTSTFTLTVTDNANQTATATLTVNVTANTAPTLGTYPNTSLMTGQSATVTPSVAPADNGSVASVTASASAGFTGTLTGNPATGAITVNTAAPAGVYTITVTATDNCGATANRTFALAVNVLPTINAAAPLTRQQGSPASVSQIAVVSDSDQAANTLNVTATPLTGAGVTISGIAVNATGAVTANVVAACAATNSTFTLTVTDSQNQTATATLVVNVAANTPPALGVYANSNVLPGQNTSVTPSLAPTDNGNIVSLTATAPGFTGAFAGNPATGVITVTNANPSGSFIVTVTATDNCGATTTANFNLGVNAGPSITAAGALARQQGSPSLNSPIATVADVDQPANTLSVTATPLSGSGVTVTGISINAAGSVTANVAASCAATNSTFTLTVTDNMGLTATATLTVNVTANTPPTLGVYSNTLVITGQGATVTPRLPPSDNGSIVSLTASAPGFSGTFSGNPLTGVITIANATPAGVFNVTVTATDNCGATANRTFTLSVNAPPTIASGTLTRQQGSPAVNSQIAAVTDPDQALNTLTVVATPLAGSGVTVSGVSVAGAGVVTANIVASCAATNSTFTLTVTDNMGATATATLTVNANANTPPTLGNYPASAVTLAGNTTIPTNAPPADNGAVVSLTAAAPGFTGALTGNLSTGVITVTNAGPAGAFPVTLTATDNCGATRLANFTLTVNALVPSLTGINPNNGPLFGGTNVTLTGVNFAAPGAVNTQVFFGTNPATSVVVVNDTTITAVSPAGASVGAVGVRVVNGNGFTNFAPFNYNQVISGTTPLGENVPVDLGDITVIFAQVTSLGVTSASQIDPATAGALPAGYVLTPDSRAFELNTTAVYTGNVVVCIRNNAAPNIQAFARKRLLHGESGPTLIDRTILPPNDPSFNFNARRVCARVTSFSPFVVASTTTSFTINGTVLDNSGAPATGVRVRVNLAGNQTPLLVADTDATGQYVLPGLIPGSYVVTPARTGSAFLPANRTFTNIATDQTADFVLVNPASRSNISGRVTNSQTGAGSPNVRVNLAGVGGILRTLTAADGTYQFPGVFGGNYSLTAERPGFSFAPAMIPLENLSADAVNQNFVGTSVITPTPTPEPGDDFSEAGRDPNRWSVGVASERAERFDPQVSVTQGADPQFPNRLRIRPRSGVDGASFSGYVSARPINLNQQSQAGVRAVRPATGAMAATAFSIGTDSLNFSRIIVTSAPLASLGIATAGPNAARILSTPSEGGQMIVYQSVSNGQSTATVQAYNNVQQQFWRYRYDAINQLLFLETSPDGLIWTLRATQNLANTSAEGFISELIAGTFDSTINPGLALFGEYRIVPPIGLRFAASNSSVGENAGAATITVVRDGNTEIPSKVDFATSNGTAIAGQDYTAVSGTLTFNVGETAKTFNVPILDDFLLEGGAPETINLTLTNASGSLLGTPNTATLGIVDDESGTNPIDDPGFFVDQHYSDFLSRSPDVSGRNYWVGQITQCGANVACINGKRIDVSAAFFNESEFFETGGLVYRLYRISHLRAPNFTEFDADRRLVVAGPNLAGSQVAYANNFTGRPEFLQRYATLPPIAFVDTLWANSGITPTSAERAFLITSLASGTLTPGQVLLYIANRAKDDAGFRQRENNRLFVLMQYFGYLRRNIDQGGFDFWLDVLQRTSNIRGMVCAFITSEEYQRRFAPIVTRTNAECANVNAPVSPTPNGKGNKRQP